MDGLDGVEYGIEHLALQCSGKGMVDIYRHKGVRSYLAHCRNSMRENIYFRNICRKYSSENMQQWWGGKYRPNLARCKRAGSQETALEHFTTFFYLLLKLRSCAHCTCFYYTLLFQAFCSSTFDLTSSLIPEILEFWRGSQLYSVHLQQSRARQLKSPQWTSRLRTVHTRVDMKVTTF